jgi:hypothetical protein
MFWKELDVIPPKCVFIRNIFFFGIGTLCFFKEYGTSKMSRMGLESISNIGRNGQAKKKGK